LDGICLLHHSSIDQLGESIVIQDVNSNDAIHFYLEDNSLQNI
jgi:hypothetical protein